MQLLINNHLTKATIPLFHQIDWPFVGHKFSCVVLVTLHDDQILTASHRSLPSLVMLEDIAYVGFIGKQLTPAGPRYGTATPPIEALPQKSLSVSASI